MSDESFHKTKSMPASGDMVKSSREAVMAHVLIGIGLIDKELLAKVQQQPPGDQLSSLLDQLIESGKLSSVQRELINRFSEVVLADWETSGGAIHDTVSLAQNLSAFQDTVTHHVTPPSKGQSPTGNFGDYEILREIARGGMGIVYKARQIKLNRIVALKMIKLAELADAEQVQRFYREAESAAKLSHPGIVAVYDIGEADGQHYFSMAFVDGESLSDRVKRDGPLMPREAARLIKEAAEAVDHAHQADIVHRDIKPQNLLLDLQGKVRVADFGLAKLQQDGSELTANGQVLGTPAYMPPEQAAGKLEDVGVLADVYSLGATLYFLLTGRPPFQSATVHDTLRQVLGNEPVPPRKLDPSIPKDVETICLKTLRKESEQRYESAKDLADDLQNWLDDKPIVARPVGYVEKAWKWARRNPIVTGSLVMLLVVAMAVQQYAVWLNRQADSERVVGALNSLATATGPAVPLALQILGDLPRELVKGELKARYFGTTGQQKLSLAYGLAQYDEVDLDELTLVILMKEAPGAEVMNLLTALSEARELAIAKLQELAETASETEDWIAKSRLAITAMHLGDASLATEMLQAFPAGRPEVQLPDLLRKFRRQLEDSEALPEGERNSDADRIARAKKYYYLDHPAKALIDVNVLAAAVAPSPGVLSLQSLALARTGAGEQAVQALERLSKATSNKHYVATVAILVQAWLGNGQQAERSLELLINNRTLDAGAAHYYGACVASQLAKINRESDPAKSERLADRAILLLRRAHLELGYSKNRPDEDPDLIPLHQVPDFLALIAELYPPTDPVQRTRFIAEFPNWCGNLAPLVAIARESDDASFQSGICLSVGGVAEPSRAGREAWRELLSEWHQNAPDGGTHGATRWALSQWGITAPEIVSTVQPIESQEWWQTPSGLTMTRIPTGEVAGKDGTVRVDQDFWLCDREASIRLFMEFIEDTEYRGPKPQNWEKRFEGFGNESVIHSVSWYDAVMFCNWLSDREGREPCYEIEASEDKDDSRIQFYNVSLNEDGDGYRLPTEAQWEYACRAQTSTVYSFGHAYNDLQDYGIYRANSGISVALAGTRRCNAWGLFDMHGNLWEWCWDKYGTGSDRVVRGGGWGGAPVTCGSSESIMSRPTGRNGNLGFRLALVPKP